MIITATSNNIISLLHMTLAVFFVYINEYISIIGGNIMSNIHNSSVRPQTTSHTTCSKDNLTKR